MATRSKYPKGRWLTWLPVFAPTILLLIFLSLGAHVCLGLGHWPTPMLEDYQSGAYDTHRQVFTWFAVFTIWVVPALWLFSLCFRPLRISWQAHLAQAGVYLAGRGLIAFYTAWDPHRFTAWFLD